MDGIRHAQPFHRPGCNGNGTVQITGVQPSVEGIISGAEGPNAGHFCLLDIDHDDGVVFLACDVGGAPVHAEGPEFRLQILFYAGARCRNPDSLRQVLRRQARERHLRHNPLIRSGGHVDQGGASRLVNQFSQGEIRCRLPFIAHEQMTAVRRKGNGIRPEPGWIFCHEVPIDIEDDHLALILNRRTEDGRRHMVPHHHHTGGSTSIGGSIQIFNERGRCRISNVQYADLCGAGSDEKQPLASCMVVYDFRRADIVFARFKRPQHFGKQIAGHAAAIVFLGQGVEILRERIHTALDGAIRKQDAFQDGCTQSCGDGQIRCGQHIG